MRGWLRNNGLSLVLLLLFGLCITGHSIAGWLNRNHEEALHSQPAISYLEYVRSGDFHESVAENWESEFLQMGMFVLLTVYLFQRGSSESRDPDEPDDSEDDPESPQSRADAPWPVRRGGLVLWAYSHSLSIAFFLLFIVSFSLHAVGGWEAYRDELVEHGARGISILEYVRSPRFWFESLENWQSEFLAIFLMVVLSIYLRERGSPQSKPIAAPHGKTGE
jgi:hypothetical protein